MLFSNIITIPLPILSYFPHFFCPLPISFHIWGSFYIPIVFTNIFIYLTGFSVVPGKKPNLALPYISENPVFSHSSSLRINGVVILSLAWTLWAMQKEHVSIQRCDESGNPTLNQLALIIPIYPNPSAGTTCVPRKVQHYGFSQSSHSCTKCFGNNFLWSSSSCSALEDESWAAAKRGQ